MSYAELIFRTCAPLAALFLLSVTRALGAADCIDPASRPCFVFSTQGEASEILARADEYTTRMSHFDRMLRLKSPQRVSLERYRQHMSANALPWTKPEKQRLTRLLRQLTSALRGLPLPAPDEVLLLKTTGMEELGQGHTRSNAIVLPRDSLALNDAELYFLIAHELFHVMTRHDAAFRGAAYALIGFRIVSEIALPPAIAPLQITNPDVPRHDSVIDVRHGGATISVVPILLSRSAVFDAQIGDELKHYWSLRLLVVEQAGSGAEPIARLRDGAPILLRLNEVRGFSEQVGRNTEYVIHPEEILAEHFALLASGQSVPEPQRIDALRHLLSRQHRYRGKQPGEVAGGCPAAQSRSAYLSANKAGCPPVCQNNTVSSLPNVPLRTRSINPAAARPV